MKKLIALLLAAMMLCGCAAIAEEATATDVVTTADGNFQLSYQIPEGVKLISGEWVDETMYMANLEGPDGLYFYFSVAVPTPDENAESAEETAPVTFNEENGYTDEYLKQMMTELYSDDYDSFDTGVKTTAYGTKLAVVRFNDPDSPSAYVFSIWNGYEVGLTLVSVGADGTYNAITEDQLNKVVDFVSEVWMFEKAAE